MHKSVTILLLMALGSVTTNGNEFAAQQSAQPSQSQPELAKASDVADRFMKGLKLAALPEGKQMLNETEWVIGPYREYFCRSIVYTEYATAFEGPFNTDLPGVQGFKRLMDVKGVSEAHTPVQRQYLLIAFPDKTTGDWKVAYFGSEIDIEKEIQQFQNYLEQPEKHPETRLVSQQEIYVSYAMWLLMNGRASDSKEALIKAEHAKTQPREKIPGVESDPQSNRDKATAIKRTISKVSGINID